MNIKTTALALYHKTVSLISAPFGLRDVGAYRAAQTVVGDTGQHVNAAKAMQLSVVFACVRIISETVATLPLLLYRRKPGGGRTVASDHPLYYLLHDSPNADQTGVEFWEEAVANIALRGRVFIHAPRNVVGDVVELRVLEFERMGTPRTNGNGTVLFPYNHPVLGLVEYTDAEVWQQRGFGGLSVIQLGARSMGAALNAEAAGSKLYGNDLRPNAVVYRDEFLTKQQREQLKDKIDDGIFRASNGLQMQLLEGGFKYEQLSLTPEDAQLLESRQFSVEDLCRWFGMNPSMIGHGTAVSNWGTGREQINLAFLQYVLRAYTKRLEQGITKWLLKPSERGRIYAEFSVEGLLRADSAGRAAFYAAMVQNGIMTRNEVRDLENLNALDGGDELTIQSNLVPATMLGQGTATGTQSAIDALKNLLGIEGKQNAT
jgi:HK97 family phage portal protein